MEQRTLEIYDRQGHRVLSAHAEFKKAFDCYNSLQAQTVKSELPPGGACYVFDSDRKRGKDGRLPLFRHTNRLTYANCTLDPTEQANRYAAWATRRGLTRISVYPAGNAGHSAEFRYALAHDLAGSHAGNMYGCGTKHARRMKLEKALPSAGFEFTEVDPADWARGAEGART